MSPFLTVAELAEHLRIRPRKVYALVAAGEIPHRRAGARLIFDAHEIDAWLQARSTRSDRPVRRPPPVLAGSHDPLLEWAVRASGAALALMTRGSRDGLARMAAGEACAAALHFPGTGTGSGNAAEVERVGAERAWVLLGLARRTQGLLVAPGNPLGIHDIADLPRAVPARIGRRQSGAGSRELFDQLLGAAGLDAALPPECFVDGLTGEDEMALAVQEGRIGCGLAIEAAARRHGLDFVALVDEELDLLVERGSYFDEALQALFAFTRTRAFRERAAALPGYSIARLGAVRWNGGGD